MVRILALDTSTQRGGIAALEDRRVLGHVFADSREDYSTRLLVELDLLLAELKLRVADFDVFAVTAGPGSFTGLRVGLTTVKAWAEVHCKPIAAVSGLQAVAAQASGATEYVGAVLDGRRAQVFGGLYGKSGEDLKPIGDEVVMRADEFVTEVYARLPRIEASRNSIAALSFVSPQPELFREALTNSVLAGARVEQVSHDLAPWIGRLAFGMAQRGELVDALTLDAKYVRRSDAESYWKDPAAK